MCRSQAKTRTHVEQALRYEDKPDPLRADERLDGMKADLGDRMNPVEELGEIGEATSRLGVLPVEATRERGVVEIGV